MEHRGDDTERDLVEALAEGTIGYTLLEKLALSIIDAHKVKDGRSRQNRLNDAMYALLGEYHGRGSKIIDDEKVLTWMATQYKYEQSHLPAIKIGPFLFGESEPRVQHDSIFSLATAAVTRFQLGDTMVDKKSVARRLTKKFRKDKDQRRESIMYASSTPHLIEYQMLSVFAHNLWLCGIPCEIPKEPMAFF